MNVQQLVALAHGERDFYVDHGHDPETCSIGWFENIMKLASDTGAIDFTVQPDGKVKREHFGCPSILVEWIGADVQNTIRGHVA